jgi:hypothetical protein
MPLLAGMYEAYAAASSGSLSSFVDELAPRLPLTLILALIVYVLVTLSGAIFSRLNGVSVAAQAARYPIERSRPNNFRSAASRSFTANYGSFAKTAKENSSSSRFHSPTG